MERVFLGLGSNLGDRVDTIRKVQEMVSSIPGVTLVSSSSLYETEPVGISDQPMFVNAVLEIETDLSPKELFLKLKDIEAKMGRRKTVRWGPRIIDIDILLFGDRIIEERDLTIPHPEMAKRGFVLVPLCEIAPEMKHPRHKKTIREIADGLDDISGVEKIEEGR
jgi:2-amino-4-hydroxy-6-hydroxymethyldihydropteridine diphosphokinase